MDLLNITPNSATAVLDSPYACTQRPSIVRFRIIDANTVEATVSKSNAIDYGYRIPIYGKMTFERLSYGWNHIPWDCDSPTPRLKRANCCRPVTRTGELEFTIIVRELIDAWLDTDTGKAAMAEAVKRNERKAAAAEITAIVRRLRQLDREGKIERVHAQKIANAAGIL